MLITIYLPEQPEREVPPPKVTATDHFSWVPELLGCVPALVDVLASGPGYVIYSIFDHEGTVNLSAMQAVSGILDIPFDTNDKDVILRGPVLIVRT